MKNFKYACLIILVTLLIGCSTTPNSTTSSLDESTTSLTSEESSSNSETSSSSISSDVPSINETVTIYLDDIQEISGGSKVADHKQTFIKLFNDARPDLLNDINCEGVYVQSIQMKDSTTKNKLTIGTGSGTGYLDLNFNVEVKEINIHCRSYFKFFSYGDTSGASIDYNCVLKFDADTYSTTLQLPSVDGEESEIQVLNETLPTPTNLITLSNVGGGKNRVFIESISIGF